MILLAFPGLGKTPLARKDPRYLDLDFGFFRTALAVPKEDEAVLYKPFADLAKMYADQGFIVLTNEPGLLKHIKVSKMFLPKDSKFSARKLGVDKTTADEWVASWDATAKQNNVPVIYLSTGLDHYLGDQRNVFTSTHKKGGKST
jgi:hypothetical protein